MVEVLCPHCKIPMEIHKTMSGDQWLCDNYNMCGGRVSLTIFKEIQDSAEAQKNEKI